MQNNNKSEVVEVLERYRGTCEKYLKLDFAILAGLAAFATYHAARNLEIALLILQNKWNLWFIVSLAAFVVLIDGVFQMFLSWGKSSETRTGVRWLIVSHVVMVLLCLLHVTAVIVAAWTGVRLQTDSTAGYLDGRAMAWVIPKIESFVDANGKAPHSLEELFEDDQGASDPALEERLRYSATEEDQYEIRAAGMDRIFGTADDRVENRRTVRARHAAGAAGSRGGSLAGRSEDYKRSYPVTYVAGFARARVHVQLNAFFHERRHYPADLTELLQFRPELSLATQRAADRLAEKGIQYVPLPLEKTVRYKRTGDNDYEIRTAGRDNVFDTEDDIVQARADYERRMRRSPSGARRSGD
ncbi:MAG: hypothetical protein PVI86_04780 [Phycisphaerae bacterium]